MPNDGMSRVVLPPGNGWAKESNSPVVMEDGGVRRTSHRETPDVETSSDAYAARFRGSAGAYLLSVQRRGVEALLEGGGGLPGASVLDVGGGHGQLAGPLAELGCQPTVIGSTRDCSARVGRGGSGVRFVTGDLLDLPFADRSYDIVVSVRLISHIVDWTRLVDELCRIAKRAVIIDYPTLASLNALSFLGFGIKRAIEENTRQYRSFWPGELRQAFTCNGFRERATFRQLLIPMAIHRFAGESNVVRSVEEWCRRARLTAIAGNPVLVRFERMTSAD